MAPKAGKYNRERLLNLGAGSAEAALRNLAGASEVERLTCDYLGVPADGGGYDAAALPRHNTNVAYQWRVRAGIYDETSIVPTRCSNIANRGVPLPDAWGTALQCLTLDSLAERSAMHVREQEPTLTEVQFEALGQAKPMPPVTRLIT